MTLVGFNSVQSQSTTSKSGKSLVKVTLHKAVRMCGFPGLLADMSIQMGTASADPAAIAALQTLCAGGASPTPAATS